MRRIIWPISACLVVAAIGLGLLLTSCESSPPSAERKPQSRPVAMAKEGSPASAPSGPALAEPPPLPEPVATQPAAAEKEPPDYITVLERIRSGAARRGRDAARG